MMGRVWSAATPFPNSKIHICIICKSLPWAWSVMKFLKTWNTFDTGNHWKALEGLIGWFLSKLSLLYCIVVDPLRRMGIRDHYFCWRFRRPNVPSSSTSGGDWRVSSSLSRIISSSRTREDAGRGAFFLKYRMEMDGEYRWEDEGERKCKEAQQCSFNVFALLGLPSDPVWWKSFPQCQCQCQSQCKVSHYLLS